MDGAVRAAPAGEGVARAREGVGRERLRRVVGEGLVGHQAGGVRGAGVEVDRVRDGRPVGDIGAVAVETVDGDGRIGRRAAAFRPAREVVAWADGGREGEGRRFVGVGGGVGRAFGERAAREVVGDGVDVAGVKGGEAVGGDAAGQGVAGEVLDGADLASDIEGVGGVGGDRALEGEDVRAAAGEVVERAPARRERRRAGDGLAERHGYVDDVALRVDAGRDGDVELGGRGGIDGLDLCGDVLGGPLVAAGLAGGVETQDDGAEVQGQDEASVCGAAAGIELLVVEGVSVAVPPWIGGACVVDDVRDGEGVGLVLGVLAAGEDLEAGHVARDADVAGVAVAAVLAVVAVDGFIHEELQVLVAVVVLLGAHAQRHAQMGVDQGVVRLGRDIAEVGRAGGRLVAVTVVAVVVGGVLGALYGHVPDIERAARRDARAGGEGARRVGDKEAARVGELDAVFARVAGLEPVGGDGGRRLRDDDVRRGLAGGERERAVVVGGVLGALYGHVPDIERAARRDARAGGEGARRVGDKEAARVGELDAVFARVAGLEPVGGDGGRRLRDDDVRRGLAGGERERAGGGGEVLAGVGAQAHGAVAHRLGRRRVVARDDELGG